MGNLMGDRSRCACASHPGSAWPLSATLFSFATPMTEEQYDEWKSLLERIAEAIDAVCDNTFNQLRSLPTDIADAIARGRHG